MDTIDIEVKIVKTIDVAVDINDVIDGINNISMLKRWNSIAKIINGLQVNLSELTDDQKNLVKEYLTDKLKLF